MIRFELANNKIVKNCLDCENKKSEHYTMSWDLPVHVIEDCEHFEEA